MTPGSDGAIHVMADNNSAPQAAVGYIVPRTATAGCVGTMGGMGAKGFPVVYRYTMHSAGVLSLSTVSDNTDFDTVLAVLSTCSATAQPLACSDDTASSTQSSLTTATLMAGQTVYIVVGGWGTTSKGAAQGNYELTLREQTPIAVGMPCHTGDLCTGSICVGATATNAGTCVADGGLGGNCRTTAPFCDTGTSCSASMPTAAAPGSCLRAVDIGAACSPSTTTCNMNGVCPTFASASGGDAGADAGTGSRVCTAPVAETEPNNSPTMPQAAISATTTFVAALPTGDTDCFAVTVPAGASLYAETSDARGTCSLGMGADTILNVYAAGNTMAIATNDDAAMPANGLCSRIDGTGATPVDMGAHALAAGTYAVCVTAFAPMSGSPAAIAQYFLTIGIAR